MVSARTTLSCTMPWTPHSASLYLVRLSWVWSFSDGLTVIWALDSPTCQLTFTTSLAETEESEAQVYSENQSLLLCRRHRPSHLSPRCSVYRRPEGRVTIGFSFCITTRTTVRWRALCHSLCRGCRRFSSAMKTLLWRTPHTSSRTLRWTSPESRLEGDFLNSPLNKNLWDFF